MLLSCREFNRRAPPLERGRHQRRPRARGGVFAQHREHGGGLSTRRIDFFSLLSISKSTSSTSWLSTALLSTSFVFELVAFKLGSNVSCPHRTPVVRPYDAGLHAATRRTLRADTRRRASRGEGGLGERFFYFILFYFILFHFISYIYIMTPDAHASTRTRLRDLKRKYVAHACFSPGTNDENIRNRRVVGSS